MTSVRTKYTTIPSHAHSANFNIPNSNRDSDWERRDTRSFCDEWDGGSTTVGGCVGKHSLDGFGERVREGSIEILPIYPYKRIQKLWAK